MKHKTFAAVGLTFIALALNACSSSESEGYENSVTLLNRESAQEQIKASDNGYCPLLPYPYDPRLPQEGAVCVKDSEGNKFCQGSSIIASGLNVSSVSYMPDSSMLASIKCKDREERKLIDITDFSYCDKIGETQMDSIQKAFDDLMKEINEKINSDSSDWEKEVLKVRTDPTRTASLAFSKNQTTINLSPVFVEAILDMVQLKDSKRNDTLFINAVPDANGSYGKMRSRSKCPISLDIAINYIDKDIAVVVFEDEQIFQAEYK